MISANGSSFLRNGLPREDGRRGFIQIKNGKGCSRLREILAAFPRPTPAFWPLWGARGKSAPLCRAQHWPRVGRRGENGCLSCFLAFEEGSTAPVLSLGCRFARKERGHFPGTD